MSVHQTSPPAREPELRFASIELARNAAVAWLTAKGAVFGPQRKIEIGRLGAFKDREVGVSAAERPWWRLRIDYDPVKGPHFNAEFGMGASRSKQAFKFPGSIETVKKLAAARAPR
jgi:hypothetical protein